MCYWNAAVDHGELITEVDSKLISLHEDKPLADLLLQRRYAIQKRERLIQAIKIGVKIKYQPDIPEAIADRNKAMQSRLEDLQQRNSRNGMLKTLSALADENEIQNYLDLEEQKRCIDEIIVNNEKWRNSQFANGEDFNKEE